MVERGREIEEEKNEKIFIWPCFACLTSNGEDGLTVLVVDREFSVCV